MYSDSNYPFMTIKEELCVLQALSDCPTQACPKAPIHTSVHKVAGHGGKPAGHKDGGHGGKQVAQHSGKPVGHKDGGHGGLQVAHHSGKAGSVNQAGCYKNHH